MASDSEIYDVLIVGGSYAGLSAALTLYRGLHTSIIFDHCQPRNSYSSPIHLVPTWDNQDSKTFYETAKAELQVADLCRYSNSKIEHARRLESGLFEVSDAAGGVWLGRKVLFSTGVNEIFPKYSLSLSRYPCMFQFGFEHRNSPSAGVLALDGLAGPVQSMKLAEDAYKFAETITIYTSKNAVLASELKQSLQSPNFRVDDREIARLVQKSSESEVMRTQNSLITIEFTDSTFVNESFLVHRPLTKLDRSLPDQLGLEYGPIGEIKTTPPFCQTSVEGVYAAGDCASMMKIIPNAICMGAYAGAGLARELPKRGTGGGVPQSSNDQDLRGKL
ncbi:hypothetical protein G7Y79_00067g095530 [Physcia stellaris]|nr:hypothetical protein G7Y79_00067g095530 [Physcia stellaris]